MLILSWLIASYFSGLLVVFLRVWLISLLFLPVVGRLIQWRISKPLTVVLVIDDANPIHYTID